MREATAADAEAMAAVWLPAALTAYAHIFPADAPKPVASELAAAITADFDDPRTRGLVAETDGRIVGAVMTGAWPNDPTTGRFHRLYVHPDCWGRGIGAALHDAAIGQLRSAGYATTKLWVLRHNTVARTMYERRGWTENGEVFVTYEPGNVEDVGYSRVTA